MAFTAPEHLTPARAHAAPAKGGTAVAAAHGATRATRPSASCG